VRAAEAPKASTYTQVCAVVAGASAALLVTQKDQPRDSNTQLELLAQLEVGLPKRVPAGRERIGERATRTLGCEVRAVFTSKPEGEAIRLFE
jgi:hypothetical protein